MAYSALDISKWFVNRAIQDVENSRDEYITPLKLQKILYYAQGSYGAIQGERLFDDPIVNWIHGPVVISVYEHYKDYGSRGIDKKTDITNFDKKTDSILEEVYQVFGQYSAWKLRDMTHEEDPWKNTKRNEEIKFDNIVDYFKREIIE